MVFIPKIIRFDSGESGYLKTYDAIIDSEKIDNIVKQYITLNPNHEFVQYLFAIDRYDDDDAADYNTYKISGFVVKVPYDIDIEQFVKLKTPLLDGYKDMDSNLGGTKRRKRRKSRTKKQKEGHKLYSKSA